MNRLLKYSLPAIFAGLAIASIANAQVTPPNYWRSVGGYIYPIQASNTIGSSSINVAANNLVISGTCTGCGGSGSGTVGPATSTYLGVFTSSSTVGGSSGLTYQSSTITLTLSNGTIPTSISANGSSSVINFFNTNYYFPVPSQLALNGCLSSSTITDAGACVNYIYSLAQANGSNLWIPPFEYSYLTGITINTAGKKMNIIGSGGGGFYAQGATTLQYNGKVWAYNYDVAPYSSAGIGLYDLDLVGPAGVYAGGSTGIGSSTAPSATASFGSVVSASSTTNLVTYSTASNAPATNPANAQSIVFTGSSLPAGITAGTTYYVGNENTGAKTFELYTTSALSTPVTITGTGTGTYTEGIVYGVWLGGPNGATSFNLQGVNISGFPIGFGIGDDSFRVSIDHDSIQKNGIDVQSLTETGGVGENNSITNSVIADCNSTGASISDYCIYLQESGNIQWIIAYNSLDDAQFYTTQYGGTANINKLECNHLEDPNTGQAPYDFVAGLANQNTVGGLVIQSNCNDYMQDMSNGLPEYVLNGANFISSGDTVEINAPVNTPMQSFVTNQDANDLVSWTGLQTLAANAGTNQAIDFVVGTSSPVSVDGLQYGTGTPAFYVSTSTFSIGTTFKLPLLATNSLLATNGSGNVVTTSTPATNPGTVTTSTALTSGQVAYGTGGSTIGTNPNFTFNSGADLLSQNATGTTAVGNFVQGGGVTALNTTTTLSGTQFCGGGLFDVVNTTSSITVTTPSTSTIASSVCASGIYAGNFSDQFLRNDSTNTVYVAVNGTGETQQFSVGTPTSLAPSQEYRVTGRFNNSSTIQGATSTGTTFIVDYTLYQTSTPLTVNGNTVTLTGTTVASGAQYYSLFASSTANASQTTINWNNSNVQELKLSTSTTVTFTNTNAGARYILMLLQDASGSRIVTWPSTVQWAAGTAPTLTTTANKLDITTFVCAAVSGTDCYAGSNLNYTP